MTGQLVETLLGWIDRRFRLIAVLVVVASATVAIVGSQLADTDEPSFDPDGEIYDTADRADEVFESTSSIRSVAFIIDRADGGDVLTADGLAPVAASIRSVVADPANAAHLVTVFDRDLGLEIDGVVSVAGAVDAALPGGLGAAGDDEVKSALAQVLDDEASTGPLRFTLAQSATAATGAWTSPAYKAELRFDLDSFAGEDDDAKQRASEAWLRDIQADLRAGADDGVRVVGAGVDPLLTSDEQGSAGGPFIFLAVGLIVLLVGALLRSYWSSVVVTSALGLTLLAFNGIVGLVGIKTGSSLISFVLPITLIAFGVDFFVHAAGRVGETDGEPTGAMDQGAGGPGARSAYRSGMVAVLPALTLAAATSITAFVANVASGIQAIIEFGLAAAIGLLVAYLVLGWLAPKALAVAQANAGPGPIVTRFGLVGRAVGLLAMIVVALVSGTVVSLAALAPAVGAVAVPGFIVVFVLAPALVVGRRHRRASVRGGPPVDRAGQATHSSVRIGNVVHGVVRARHLTLAVFVGLGAVALLGATRVESAFQVSDFFSPKTDFMVGLDRLDEHYGAATGGPAFIYLEGDLADVSTIAAMDAAIDEIARTDAQFARDLDGELIVLPTAAEVLRTTMVTPGAAASASAQTGVPILDADGDQLPDTPEAIRAVWRSGREIGVVGEDGTVVFTPEQVQTIVSVGNGSDGMVDATTLTVLVTSFTDDEIILGARDALDEAAARLSDRLGPDADLVSVSGEVIASQDSLAAFTDAMVVSLPIAVALTVLIVGLALRSVRYSAVTILPILLVVFGVWGYMWLRGFTINVITATIAAIAVGVGIDFCTHLTVRFREELAIGLDRFEAVRRAGEGTGAALAVSAATSIVGFGVMTAAPAPIFSSFGELMAVMIAMSALVALIVLPCLLVVVTPAEQPKPAPEPVLPADVVPQVAVAAGEGAAGS